MTKKVNVTFNRKIVGTAEVDEKSGVVEFVKIEPDDLEYILPGYDPVADLSIREEDALFEQDQWLRGKGTFSA